MTILVDPVIDAARYRQVLGHYPTGVCVVTATDPDGEPVAMVVGSFTSVSLDPPLVGFFPDKASTSWPRIAAAGHFCVNILARDQGDLCRRFATKGGDKFAGLSFTLSGGGAPVLDDVVAWMECRLYAVHEAGDHYIALGQVQTLDIERGDEPLLFFRGRYGNFAAQD